MIGRELRCPEDRNLAGPHVGRADEDLGIPARPHAIEVDQRLDRIPQRIDIERIGLVGTHVLGNDFGPGPIDPTAKHPAEQLALVQSKRRIQTGPTPERFEGGARPIDPALEPALHHHHSVHRAGTGTGDRFNGQTPVLEKGVKYAPGEGAMRPATLQSQRHRLFGMRPSEATEAGEAGGFAPTASKAPRHDACRDSGCSMVAFFVRLPGSRWAGHPMERRSVTSRVG